MNQPLTLSIDQVAAVLGVARSTIYESIRRGDFPLPVIRIGARRVVSMAALAQLLGVEMTEVVPLEAA